MNIFTLSQMFLSLFQFPYLHRQKKEKKKSLSLVTPVSPGVVEFESCVLQKCCATTWINSGFKWVGSIITHVKPFFIKLKKIKNKKKSDNVLVFNLAISSKKNHFKLQRLKLLVYSIFKLTFSQMIFKRMKKINIFLNFIKL